MRSAASPPIQALIFVHIPTHFSEMIRVAELLRETSGYRPLVLFAAMYEGVRRDMDRCRRSGIDFITEPELHAYQPQTLKRNAGPGWKDRLRRAFSRWEVRPRTPRTFRIGLPSVLRGRPPRIRNWIARHLKPRLNLTEKVSKPGLFHRLRRTRPSDRTRALATRTMELGASWKASSSRRIRNILRRTARWTSRQLNAPTPAARLRLARSETASAVPWPAVLAFGPLALASAIAGAVLMPLRWPLRWLALRLFGAVYRKLPRFLPPDIQAQRHLYKVIPGFLNARDIRLVILPEDNFYYFTNLYVKAVHERHGAAVIVPFTIVNMLEWAEAFRTEPSHDADRLLNAIIAFLFPRWRHFHRGRSLVMPAQQVLCNEYFKTAPAIPWLINSSHADAIAVESKFMNGYYLNAGIPKHQLKLTGALYDDVLHRTMVRAPLLRSSMYRRLGACGERPMLLCALPPNQLAGAGRKECEFSDYQALLEAFLAPLRSLAATHHCILSLHPRIDPAALDRVDLGDFHVVPDNIATLIPLSKLYIASCSATIRLAINCGIPVVNYDVYRYDYDDYKTVPGVLTIDDLTMYEQTLTSLCLDETQYRQVRVRQQEFAATHAMVDGMAGRRILEVLDAVLPAETDARAHQR